MCVCVCLPTPLNGMYFQFSLLHTPLRTVLSALSTNRINVTYTFHSLFCSQARSEYISIVSLFFPQMSARTATPTRRQVLFFILLLIKTKCGFLVGIRWPICISRSQRILSILFSKKVSYLFLHYLLVWSNFSLLDNYQRTTFPTPSCYFFFFFACLPQSLIMWLILILWDTWSVSKQSFNRFDFKVFLL